MPGLGAALAAPALTALRQRRPSAAAILSPLVVGAVAAVMWISGSPTYFQVQQGNRLVSLTAAQVARAIVRGTVPSRWRIFPYSAFTPVTDLPPGAVVAWAWSGGPIDYAHVIIGNTGQHRLVVLGWPSTATALAAQMQSAGAIYVLLSPNSGQPQLLAEVRADTAQFTALTHGGTILGEDLYRFRPVKATLAADRGRRAW